MNNDLISRDALKKAITEATYNFEQIPIRVDEVMQIINNAPTVEYTFEEAFQKTVCDNKLYCPARSQGEWIEDEKGIPICSVCHNGYKTQPRCMGKPMFEYCPICGAKMQKGGKEE